MTDPASSKSPTPPDRGEMRGGKRRGAGRPREGRGKRTAVRLSEELRSWVLDQAAELGTYEGGRFVRGIIDRDREDPAELEDPGHGPEVFLYRLSEPQRAHLTARAEEEGLSVAGALRAILEARRRGG